MGYSSYRRVYRKRKASKKVPTARIKRIVRSVAEVKWKNYDSNFTPATVNWQINSFLPTIVQGTDSNTRIGDKIFLKQINIAFTMKPVATLPLSGSQCRFILYHNKQCNGVQVAATTIFAANGSIDSPRNIPKKHQVSLLRDQIHQMIVTASTGATNATGPTRTMRFVIYPKKRIEYTGASGAIADILKDDYGYGFMCSDLLACEVDIHFQVLFTDA